MGGQLLALILNHVGKMGSLSGVGLKTVKETFIGPGRTLESDCRWKPWVGLYRTARRALSIPHPLPFYHLIIVLFLKGFLLLELIVRRCGPK